MRILVVDDSAFMRKAISQMITSDPSLQVVGIARNGKEAVAMAADLKPDVITMDIEMPEMDGLTALRHIMRDCPTQVLMFSSLSNNGPQAAIRALNLGAADILAKDTSHSPLDIKHMRDDLLECIHALNPARFKPKAPKTVDATQALAPDFRAGQFDVVCIGASTGGPPVLQTLLSDLPATLRTPIVIAQHMPRSFTESLAQRLEQCGSLPVHHVTQRQPLEPGHVYLAPGGEHLQIEKAGFGKWSLNVTGEPANEPYKPSVNVLFESAAHATGRRTLGIMLTGIGKDGLAGGKILREKGGTLLAQDEQSCVVYGMPKAITNAGLSAASLSPDELHLALRQLAPA